MVQHNLTPTSYSERLLMLKTWKNNFQKRKKMRQLALDSLVLRTSYNISIYTYSCRNAGIYKAYI